MIQKNKYILKAQYGIPIIAPAQSWGELKKRFDKGSEIILKVLEPIGKAVVKGVAGLGGNYGTSSVPYTPRTVKGTNRQIQEQRVREKQVEKAMPYLSPSNHIVAWTQGSVDPKVGQEKIAKLGPTAQLASLGIDMIGFKYGPKVIKKIPKTTVNTVNKIRNNKNQNVLNSYTYKTSPNDPNTIDLFKEFLNQQKIQGLEYTADGLKQNSKNVQIGLPENIKNYLNENTIERNIRAMREAGYSEREIQMYKDKVNEEMSKVRIGQYSGEDYSAANYEDSGGFFNNENNFISINKDAYLKDPKFTPDYVMKHEGRHLIDHRTGMVDELNKILEEAYDKDFLDIPNHEDAGSLKGYQYMDKERVTTNRDARDVLLSSKGKKTLQNKNNFMQYASKYGLSGNMVNFQNLIIKYVQPEDIVNAIENSNGYGKRYIKYLRENNKLTPEKIEQFRRAMMHVGGYVAPTIGGYSLYNMLNNQNSQMYNK